MMLNLHSNFLIDNNNIENKNSRLKNNYFLFHRDWAYRHTGYKESLWDSYATAEAEIFSRQTDYMH